MSRSKFVPLLVVSILGFLAVFALIPDLSWSAWLFLRGLFNNPVFVTILYTLEFILFCIFFLVVGFGLPWLIREGVIGRIDNHDLPEVEIGVVQEISSGFFVTSAIAIAVGFGAYIWLKYDPYTRHLLMSASYWKGVYEAFPFWYILPSWCLSIAGWWWGRKRVMSQY